MSVDERTAFAAIRSNNWIDRVEDVWLDSPYHVEGLHASTREVIDVGLTEAKDSTYANPIGIVVRGQPGAGKTNLLWWVRRRAQDSGGYFFLVTLLSGETFWKNVTAALREDLHRSIDNGDDQLKRLLRSLGERLGLAKRLQKAIAGEANLTPRDMTTFIDALWKHDRETGLQCADAAIALVLYGANDRQKQHVGEAYLLSIAEHQTGDRAAWGMHPEPKTPERLTKEISRLLALTGPTVIAVDQLDTVIPSEEGRLVASEEIDRALGVQIAQVADGLMSLHQITRRTLCLLSCLPGPWESIKRRAAATVPDRFQEPTTLGRIGSAQLAQELIERRFANRYARVGFEPPFPTWPVHVDAFRDAPEFTPRDLFQRVNRHVVLCLNNNHYTVLDRLVEAVGERGDDTSDDRERHGGGGDDFGDFAKLDEEFAQQRAGADVSAAVQEDLEDLVLPDLLAAGLTAWSVEQGLSDRTSCDSVPGSRPALHARLRLTLEESSGAEAHWSFRGIASSAPVAALNRIRSACEMAGLDGKHSRRHLYLLRQDDWNQGPRTQEAVTLFNAMGGKKVALEPEDVRTFAALLAMQTAAHPSLHDWLVERKPATQTALLSEALADAAELLTPAQGHEANASSGTGKTRRPGPRNSPETRPEPGQEWVTLGRTATGGRVATSLESFRRHTAIFAGSGSGKTVLLRRLIEECALLGVSSVVLDPNNDLARLGDAWPSEPSGWWDGDSAKARDYLSNTDVVIWTPRRSAGRPLTFRPLPDFQAVLGDVDEFDAAVDAAVHALAPKANVAGPLPRAQRGQAVLRESLRYFARSGGVDLQQLIELLADLPDGISTISRAERIASEMADGLKAAMVNDPLFAGTGEPVDPGVLLTPSTGKRTRISVISMVGLPADEQRQSFVGQLQMAMFAWIKKHPAGDRPLGGLFVMDEAQTFAPSGPITPCTNSTLALASQARKYGLGLIFATQAPKGVHNRIPGNAMTQFFGLLSAPEQIKSAQEVARSKGGVATDIGRLRQGEFYVACDETTFDKVRTPLCLTYHPRAPLGPDDVISRASGT
jgi:hypothetical protein